MLKLKRYPKRSPYYVIRGTVAGVRIFESAETTDRLQAEAKRIKREREIFNSAGLGKERPASVAEAMTAYLDAGGEARFILPLLDHFKEKPLNEIGQPEVDQAAAALLPGTKASTRARQVYGPMKAVLRHALDTQMPGAVYRKIRTPKIEQVPAKWAAKGALDALLAEAGPNLKAWVLVSTYTGLRASEMLRQRRPDYRQRPGWVAIGKTKNGTSAFVPLPPVAMDAVEATMPAGLEPVFGFRTVQGVNSALRRAAKRAGVPYLSTHQIGRHTFAARLLNAGHDIKTVKEAGRWKKLAVVDERYGHLEIRTVHEAMLKVAGK